MTPQELAMMCANASTKCEKYKCPFAAKCKGSYETCVMKEIAMIIRANLAEIDTLNAVTKGLSAFLVGTKDYIVDLEKINRRYRDLIIAFGKGYKPKKPGSVRRVPKKRLNKKKKDPTEMDGDERYAFDPDEKPEPEAPLVVI